MKLLFDQNLSRHLVQQVADQYPNSQHVFLLGLHEVADVIVWQYARDQDYVIVTKDADFSELSTVLGAPPKVV